MLSIGRVAPGNAAYYLDSVADTPHGYYLGHGEAPGAGTGTAAGSLGLAGRVDPEVFRRVLDGRHPHTGERLVPASERRVGGFDLTFSAPKSVSLLWALHPDPAVREVVADAHRAAIADGLAYLEDRALWARRGRDGRDRVPVTGLAAAAFDHRASRAGDPQLHTHVVVANMVPDHAGRWSAPDGRGLFRHARTAGFVYQARLRHDLTRRLGVTWGPVRSGQADLAGIGRDAIEWFSTRRAQIVDALETRGLSSSAAARVATLDTRHPKHHDHELGSAGLFDRWAALAADVGVEVAGLAGRLRSPVGPDPDRLVEGLLGVDGLTAHASTFDRRQVITALAEAHGDGVTLADLDGLAGKVTAHERTVNLGPEPAVGVEQRWTTVDLVALEADIEHLATRPPRTGAGMGMASDPAVAAALADRPQLSADQAEVVRGVTQSDAAVVTVVGKAGTGKTFAFDAARDAWTATGVPVVGAALAARAAAELQAGSGIPSTTLARLLIDMARPEGRLAPGSVVVVDEAGMVGTRHLHHLLTAAADQQARVVLVGDPAQLPEIAAGGAFRRLTTLTPNHVLSVNRRQTEGWERAALDHLRDRHPRPALARYGDRGRITMADTAPAARQAMAADWHTARHDSRDVVMLAVRRSDVAELNQLAQTHLVDTGTLDPNGPTVALGHGQRALVGDEIVCGRNDRRAGLFNGTRLTVTHIDPDTHTLTGRSPDSAVSAVDVTVPGTYVDQGHVALGYASTIHKAQGRTVDIALLLGDDRLFAEAGYVGLSRGRDRNQLYVVATPQARTITAAGDGLIDHLCDALGVSRAQTLSTAQIAGGPTPDQPLRDLVADQTALRDRLLDTMPLPDHLADDTLRARHAWTAEHRRDGEHLARITAAIHQRTDRLGTAAVIDPPDHLTNLLGPVPDQPAAARHWAATAGTLEAWRELSDRDPHHDGARAFLAEPAATHPAHPWWRQAVRALDGHQRDLDRRSPGRDLTPEPEPEPDPDLDRSWRPTHEKGRSL